MIRLGFTMWALYKRQVKWKMEEGKKKACHVLGLETFQRGVPCNISKYLSHSLIYINIYIYIYSHIHVYIHTYAHPFYEGMCKVGEDQWCRTR